MPNSTNPEFGNMRERVKYALGKKKLLNGLDDEVIDTIAIVAAGYLEVMGSSLGLLIPPIPEKSLAMRLVLYFKDGHTPYPPTKAAERPLFRSSVDGLVAGMDPPLGNATKATLASLSLGAWDEADLKAMKTFIVGYMVSLFKTGLD